MVGRGLAYYMRDVHGTSELMYAYFMGGDS